MSGDRNVSLNCRDAEWARPPYHSFTLLRAEFDAWLASKAEDAGAMLACNICVDDLLTENGKVIGIRAGEDEMFADVVIAADGVNSILGAESRTCQDVHRSSGGDRSQANHRAARR